MDTKQLEKQIYRSTWDDGLLDAFAGLALVLIGVIWFTDAAGIAGVVPALLVPIWFLARKQIAEPRTGRVTFGQERRRSVRLFHFGLVVGGIAMFALGLTAYFGFDTVMRSDFLSTVIPAVPAALLALPAIAIGLFLGLGRFLFYGAVLVAAGGLVILLDTGPALSLLLGGIIILLAGIYLLARFIRTHPVVSHGESA